MPNGAERVFRMQPLGPLDYAFMPYQKVLVGTDGSVGARRAENVAARLSAAGNASLVLVAAYEDDEAEADRVLEEAARAASLHWERFVSRKQKGHPVDVIVEAAEREPADVIVVGNKGMTTSSRFFLGSVADRISHQAPCDLLITSGSSDEDSAHPYHKILIGTDGSETSIEAAGRALALAELLDATAVMFYAGHPKTAEIVFEEVWQALKPAKVFETAVVSGDPADKLCETAEKEGFDLIVIGNRGMSQGKFHLGSVPNKVSHHAPRDLLVVKTVSRTIEELREGEGAILVMNGDKVAAYREPGGALHLMSPRCQHMGCPVGWNAIEKTWDCPCHGSRYSPDGNVLRGPASSPLTRL